VVFCPTARGPCPGRANCRLWIRGRILYTDSKLLAAQLARFVLKKANPESSRTIPTKAREIFWQNQGIPNIQREIIIDRYLREKVNEVETLALNWIRSPGFRQAIIEDERAKTKESSAPHTPHCKSPP
jgi:hypothetical protein